MRITIVLAVLALLVAGCTNHEAENRVQELQQQNANLQNATTQLNRDIAARDEYLDTVSEGINQLYASVEEVKARENALLKETNQLETGKKLTREETRARLIDRIGILRTTLADNHKKMSDLQTRLRASKRQYAGLVKLVDNLKQNLTERDSVIAVLGQRVQGMQQQIDEQGRTITQRDSVINDQHRQITTAYYVAGTRDQLEKMGIIKKEGGFLWGLLGSTTTLASGFDDKYFKPIDNTTESTIHLNAKIDEIVPKRGETLYQKTETEGGQSDLTIAQPSSFWKDKYLVIITDQPVTN